MARVARQLSESGHYHVIMRGAGRRLLFEDDDDVWFFLDGVKRFTSETDISVIAWCLMDNHVHLLLKSPAGVPSLAMAKIEGSFATIHNRRVDHVGPVFQGRFKSVPIETDGQLLACVRYIHDNPQKAGICAAAEYPLSSYHEYVGVSEVADTRLVLSMVGGVGGFKDFSAQEPCFYDSPHGYARLSSADAVEIMDEAISPAERLALDEGPRDARNAVLSKLKQAGLSVRQIERLTGIGRNIIYRA